MTTGESKLAKFLDIKSLVYVNHLLLSMMLHHRCCFFFLGQCYCWGEIATAKLYVNKKVEFKMKKKVVCCSYLRNCIRDVVLPCCMEEWRSVEQPIFDGNGEGVGFIKGIRHKERTQVASIDLPGATIEQKAVLSILPWHEKGGNGNFDISGSLSHFGIGLTILRKAPRFTVGTDSELMLTSKVSSFRKMLNATNGLESHTEGFSFCLCA